MRHVNIVQIIKLFLVIVVIYVGNDEVANRGNIDLRIFWKCKA